jgi:diamine N-acetyltransferase
MVTLRAVDDGNRAELEALSVTPQQEAFVASVSESLRDAVEEPDGRAKYWGVYEAATPVGFVMISDDVGGPGYIPQYLWRLLIDRRFQRRGYGTATLDLITAYFRGRPGVTEMWTSAGRGPGSPLTFYERYGFEQTGEVVFDDELLLRLDLRADH